MPNIEVLKQKSLNQWSEIFDRESVTPEQREAALLRVQLLKRYLIQAQEYNCEAKTAQIMLAGENIEVTDDVIWDKISDNDIVEAYDFEGKQVYCNSLFLKTTGYDIEEFLLYDSFKLFHRPNLALEGVKRCALKTTDSDSVINVNVKPYVIQENFSKTRYKFKIEHGYMCGLRDKTTKKRVGFLSTIRAQKLTTDAENIGIL